MIQELSKKVLELEKQLEVAKSRERTLREALEKIRTDDWVHGGRAILGNESSGNPDMARFYTGYNAGIHSQFNLTAQIACAALAATPDPTAAQESDTRRLDWWEKHLNYEHGMDYETGEILMYRVTGGINDREWHEVSRADTLRLALDAAAQEPKPLKGEIQCQE